MSIVIIHDSSLTFSNMFQSYLHSISFNMFQIHLQKTVVKQKIKQEPSISRDPKRWPDPPDRTYIFQTIFIGFNLLNLRRASRCYVFVGGSFLVFLPPKWQKTWEFRPMKLDWEAINGNTSSTTRSIATQPRGFLHWAIISCDAGRKDNTQTNKQKHVQGTIA